MKYRVLNYILCIMITCSSVLQAKDFYFRHIDFAGSMVSPSAISIYQDNKGLIWFGNDCLNRYDGLQVRSYRLSTYLPQIEDTNIHALCGDQDSLLYFLANDKIIRLNMQTEEFTDLNISAKDLYFEKDTVYYISQNILYAYTEGKTKEIVRLNCRENEKAETLYKMKDKWLLGTSQGLYSYVENKWNCLLDNVSVSTLFVDDQNRIWVGGINGAWVFNGDMWKHYQEHDPITPLVGNYVRCINQDEHGNIWIGTYTGISVIDSGLTKSIPIVPQGNSLGTLRNSSVHAIYRDRQGGMWIGTYFGGISYYNPDSERFSYYGFSEEKNSGLHGFHFTNMAEDGSGNLFIAAEHGGVSVLDRQTGEIHPLLPKGNPLSNLSVKDLWYDRKHERLYMATFREGLYCYTQNKELIHIGENILKEEGERIVNQLLPYKSSLILVTQGGLFILDLDTQFLSRFVLDSTLNDQINGIIRTAYIDSTHRLWLSVPGKDLICINLETAQIETPKEIVDKLGKSNVHWITEGKEHSLIFLIPGAGVHIYYPTQKHWVGLNQANGYLLSDEVVRAAVISPDRLLITSLNGFTWLDLTSDKKSHWMLGHLFPLQQLNDNCGIYVSPLDSTIFIGGVGGLLAVKNLNVLCPNTDYELVWSSISINNEWYNTISSGDGERFSIPYLESLDLQEDQNNITFCFSSTNYRNSEKELYMYKLNELDEQWMETRLHQITYTSLSPGTYELVVRELNSGKELHLPIIIRPPFYASVYAYIVYVVIALCILFWLYRFNRSRRLLKQSLQREHEEKLQVEKANQMKLKFYTEVSHEIRTPLTLIMAQLDWLLSNYEIDYVIRNRLLRLKQHTAFMRQLINEILDFRRLEQGKMTFQAQKVDIIAWLKDYVTIFADHAQINHIKLVLEMAEDSLWVWMDQSLMQKVMNNLIFNAFKFTPEGGTIKIIVQRRKEWCVLKVEDTGIGISKEEQNHIFDRFYQVGENSNGGSGIGLALTYEIIQLHKGNITVTSEVNKGTSFEITLRLGDVHLMETEKDSLERLEIVPMEEEKTENGNSIVPLTAVSSEVERYKVLLIEDNEDLRSLLKEAFSWMYEVYTASDGEDGLECAIKVIPDLIISDVMMPRLSGIEMVQKLKSRLDTAHIPIILLTARTDEEKVIEGLKSGVADYITKPFRMELLLLKCNNILTTIHAHQEFFKKEVQTSSAELATNQLDKQLLEDSTRIIEDNLDNKDFSIEMWCREIAIGRTRLGMKIKGITGLTLNEFVLQIKLRKAAELLCNKELTIAEVAWKSGFSSSGYMGKCFKEHFGVTPGQYRDKQITNL